MDREICFKCVFYKRATKDDFARCKRTLSVTKSGWTCRYFSRRNHQAIKSSLSPTLVHGGGK